MMRFHKILGWAMIVGVMFALGCSRAPSRVRPPSIDASAAAARAIELHDADRNGKLGGSELDAAPGLKAALAQIDANGDGALDAEEIAARIRAWQASRIGRMSMSCRVTRNGRPLAGAEVKFVPEKFLGPNMPTAAGRTNADGRAAISAPTDGQPGGPPGVPPGLYRVEITKSGENIPEKYNVSTILGQEVASDALGARGEIRFDLKY